AAVTASVTSKCYEGSRSPIEEQKKKHGHERSIRICKASSSKSANDSQYYKNEAINYIAEIRQMMHGFGDCSEPLVESAKIIEDVVLHQMRAIVKKVCEVAERRGTLKKSNIVTAEDFIFLLRKDKIKLQRLLKYLELKQFKASVNKVLKNDVPEDIVDDEPLQSSKPKGLYHKFLSTIDNTGELLENTSVIDEIKLNRLIGSVQMVILQYPNKYGKIKLKYMEMP
ncbi:hypothetical protein KPH14_012666, partial [Odynerus spinipes]